MDVTVKVAVIGSIVTLFAALITTLVSYFRERSEKEKWKRTLELEERRIKNEEIKWALELNNQRELELHKVRLRTYPEVFSSLSKLSSHNLHLLDEKQIQELADQLTNWGYGEAGLCMLPDTRDALFSLRDLLGRGARKELSKSALLRELSETQSIRIDVVELLRRDLNHNWSQWREIKPLIDINREKIQQLTKSQKEEVNS